jgi:ribonucleoside-diphosphate reductase alpha chain
MHTEANTPASGQSAPLSTPETSDNNLSATAPGQIRVIKRNGTVVPFTDDKISIAITKAFLAVEGGTAAASSRIRETVGQLVEQVTGTFKRRMPSGGTIHIEDIQDQVELALMRSGEHKIARAYVIYRAEHAKQREEEIKQAQANTPDINVVMPDGTKQPLDIRRLYTVVDEACSNLEHVDAKKIVEQALKNLYDGVSLQDLNTSLVMTARTMIEEEPNYTYVTARLLLDQLRGEALGFLNIAELASHEQM